MKTTNHERDHEAAEALRYILVPLLMEMQKGKCAKCKRKKKSMDIDHKKYGPDVTLYDLQLLCVECHAKKHPKVGFFSGRTSHSPLTHP